jgi:GNAT superfamily N-acetyltransferase
MKSMRMRPMEPDDRSEIADLICVSTNYWYQSRGNPPVFSGGPTATEVFFDVYQALDPGCGMVVENMRTGRLMGSCFVHPRETHVSLGILNVHPNYFGQGVARALLKYVTDLADQQDKPVRLVSSAMNMDSYSLYTRTGFVPRRAYQDMYLAVPDVGLNVADCDADQVRDASPADVEAIAALEMKLMGIRRPGDFRHFIENRQGFWHLSVIEEPRGQLAGFMASSAHPGCNMIGPGASRTPHQAAALLLAELNRHKGRRPIFLVPVDCEPLVRQAYQWGARNFEIHFAQVRGRDEVMQGVNMPTFLPETA